MEFLCKICDIDIIQIQSKLDHYIATLAKEYDRSFYENYIIINPNLDEIDKILNDYITSHNNKFNICFIKYEFFLVFDNIFKIYIETNYFF